MGTLAFLSPMGHHTWPHIPGTSATASPMPTTPHRGFQKVAGPQNKLPEGDRLPHSPPSHHPAHCHSPPATFLPPSWQLCRLEVISLTAAAAGQPHRHPGLALAGPRGRPQIVVTHSPARLPRRRCADTHIHADKHTPLPPDAGLLPASCLPEACCCHPAPRGPPRGPHWAVPPLVPPYQRVLYLPRCRHLMLLGWLDGASRRSRGASTEGW